MSLDDHDFGCGQGDKGDEVTPRKPRIPGDTFVGGATVSDLQEKAKHEQVLQELTMTADYDSPETIIEAVREWQEAKAAFVTLFDDESINWRSGRLSDNEQEIVRTRVAVAMERQRKALAALESLRLPPKGEGR